MFRLWKYWGPRAVTLIFKVTQFLERNNVLLISITCEWQNVNRHSVISAPTPVTTDRIDARLHRSSRKKMSFTSNHVAIWLKRLLSTWYWSMWPRIYYCGVGVKMWLSLVTKNCSWSILQHFSRNACPLGSAANKAWIPGPIGNKLQDRFLTVLQALEQALIC